MVVILCLASKAMDWPNAPLTTALSDKAHVLATETLAQARRHLISTERPRAVLVSDMGVTLPEYRDIHSPLVLYAQSGGTVIYCGTFSCNSLHQNIRLMFKTSWGLQWSPCAYTNMDVIANPRMVRLDVASLVYTYCSKATYLGNVSPEDAVYVDAPPLPNEDTEEEDESWIPPNRSTMTFAPSGLGHVGYVGHAFVDEVIRKAIIAMCFRRGSRVVDPPGTGIPPIRVSFTLGLLFISTILIRFPRVLPTILSHTHPPWPPAAVVHDAVSSWFP